MRNQSSNTKKTFISVLLCMIVLFALLIGSFTYITRYKITDIDSSISNDGQYKVVFQAVGEPDWPFGYSHARIVLKRGKKTVSKHKFDVANDGSTLWPDNWSVTWQENCVQAVISGEEQYDILYTFYFDGTIESETPDEQR